MIVFCRAKNYTQQIHSGLTSLYNYYYQCKIYKLTIHTGSNIEFEYLIVFIPLQFVSLLNSEESPALFGCIYSCSFRLMGFRKVVCNYTFPTQGSPTPQTLTACINSFIYFSQALHQRSCSEGFRERGTAVYLLEQRVVDAEARLRGEVLVRNKTDPDFAPFGHLRTRNILRAAPATQNHLI